MSRSVLLSLGVLAVTCCCPCLARGAEHPGFFVATTGADANPGTEAKPFATLERARDAVREMKKQQGLPKGGVTVWLREGTYFLTKPFDLSKEDGGTEEAPIAYQSYGKEKVWLNGGRRIAPSHFKPVTDAAVLKRIDEAARGSVLQLDMKAEGITDYLPELPPRFMGFTREYPILLEVFCNNERMQLARWPNEGFAHFAEIIDAGSGIRDKRGAERPGVFTYEGDRPSRWNVEEGVWLQGYWARAYLCTVVKVGKIDTEKKEITWAVPLWSGMDTWGAKRFFALNLLEELDAPGEWYLDRKAGILYFWPPKPINECAVTLSMLKDAVVSIREAADVTLRGVGIEGGREDGVLVEKCNRCEVVGCTVRNVGRHGIQILGGESCGVVGCDVRHTGHGGVILAGGDRKTLTPGNHYAVNNHIHHSSRVRPTHAGALRLSGVGLRGAHNLIHHEPHSAVWYHGNDLVMEYNHIYWAHTETTEGGVFYTGYDWTTRGNVIRHNYIHHINDSLEGSPTSVNVVHEDDCSAGTTFVGNICYRVGRGVSICGGPDNVVDNCIFLDTKLGVALSTRGLEWWTWHRRPDGTVYAIDTRSDKESCGLLDKLKRVPYNQPLYAKYPHLADILDRDPIGAPWYCVVTRNIGAGEGQLLSVARSVKDEWVTIKDNWANADENFANPKDPAAADFRLKDDAPILKQGFKPIPFEKIGLINDDTRASWPVNPEPPPEGWRPRWMVLLEQEKKMPTGLPVVPVKRTSAVIAIDGAVDPEEWTPGEKGGVMVETYEPVDLLWTAHGEKAKLPSKAWIEVDDQNLYVAFVNDINPDKGVTGGQKWGKDDAVEIALALVADKEVGPIMVLRGYSNGHFESSDEAGAPKAVVERVKQDVQYAANVLDKGHWSAEWKVPFASLGIDPKKHNPRILFNLSVRKPADDLWVMWKRSGGYTWDVKKGGVLWLAPFGDIAFNAGVPSQANIHVMGADGVTMKAGRGCEVATWAKPLGSRLTAGSDDLTTKEWKDLTFTFTPEKDGIVTINLMGRGHTSAIDGRLVPVWVYYDDITAEGADLTNGGFEELDEKGNPLGWLPSLEKGILVKDGESACTGKHCVKAWHNGRFVQKIAVKKDRPVTIRAKVRGEAQD